MKKDVIFDLMKEVLTKDDRLVFGYVYGSLFSIAQNPPTLKLRRVLLAIHPRCKQRGILAKENKIANDNSIWMVYNCSKVAIYDT